MIKHDLNDPSWIFLRLPAKYAGQNAVMTPHCSLLKKTQIKKNDVYYATAEKKCLSHFTHHGSNKKEDKLKCEIYIQCL